MTDLECFKIESLAITHLLKCAFEDWAISTVELTTELKELRKELKE